MGRAPLAGYAAIESAGLCARAGQKAGMRDGDIIRGIEDSPVADIDWLHRQLTETQVGVETSLVIL